MARGGGKITAEFSDPPSTTVPMVAIKHMPEDAAGTMIAGCRAYILDRSAGDDLPIIG